MESIRRAPASPGAPAAGRSTMNAAGRRTLLRDPAPGQPSSPTRRHFRAPRPPPCGLGHVRENWAETSGRLSRLERGCAEDQPGSRVVTSALLDWFQAVSRESAVRYRNAKPAGEGEGSGRVVRGDGLAPRSRSEGAADGVGAAGGGDPAFIPGVEAGVQGQRPGQEGRRRHASVAAQPPLFLPRSGGAVQGPRNLHSKVRYSRCIRYSVAIPPGSDDDEARARPSRPVPSPIQRGSP